ncbi:alpha-mannosidase 2-like [Oppia nitens]|uniref:alpha-mannosidase 2-like n=1 Tax=Oppia nitens TaxID=1686743 RepID=UPI0023DB4D0E|nr:alpha-mannosidase 2-like [Oppia nitens]
MYRLTKKKSTRSLYLTIILVFLISLFTAFVYYFVLIDELEIKPKTIVNNNDNIEKQINYRLSGLELGLKQNRDLLKSIRYKLDKVFKDINENINKQNEEIEILDYIRDNSICLSKKSENVFKSNISLSDVYEELKFDNTDGGVWKQGWELIVNETAFTKANKLKVFVVPHSHNDPGWIKTFDRYFREQTKHILDNSVNKLSQNTKLKFIWAETSYLSAWWETVKDDQMRVKMKQLAESGQLEIVTGGWVMNDEANVHYFAIITQLVEGHEWLMDHLGVKPKYGWAIDPFGLSPTMAFILKEMGFEGMVVQRVHYAIKKYLAYNKQLEFRWRQSWESNVDNDIVAHIEPFYSYDVPHTCGPDPKICCQFDFKRLPPSRVKCPWKVPPQKITDNNIHQRSLLLLDQYRKKSMLYKTKSLLVPIGDDFRFDKTDEWDLQSENYQKLFDYMNSRPEFNVEIKFATLSDYFESLKGQTNLPTLTGDFFTYSDRDDHYWSGYYTSKPFYKRFERILESHLRSTEIIYSLATIVNHHSIDRLNALLPMFVYARQNLALFQHHDGITGTAKDVVVNDYANRMFKSLENLEKISAQSIINLLHYETNDLNELKFVDKLPNSYTPSVKTVFTIDNNDQIWYFVIFNSLGFSTHELVCIHVKPILNNWCIKDNDGIQVENIQINKVWAMDKLLDDRIEACFTIHMKALSLVQYSVEVCNDIKSHRTPSAVTLYNFDNKYNNITENIISYDETPTEIHLETDNIGLKFSGADGMLRQMTINDMTINLRMKFMTYGTRPGSKKVQKSGAYIFLPDNENAQDLVYSNCKIRITKGNILTKFETIIEKPIPIRHQIAVIKDKKYIEMENEFLITHSLFGNKELMIRFFSDIENSDIFYTDLNGFQMIKRKRYTKIPLQGNIYPMPTTVYIEDEMHRLSVLSGQPLGTTSPRSGWVDIFLDRRLLQDDQRGLNQGVVDNRKTRETFKLLLERVSTVPSRVPQELKPTLESQLELQKLLTPPVLMYSTFKSTLSEVYFLHNPFPCNIHLMNLRRSSKGNKYNLFLHRWAVSCEAKCANASAIELTKHFSPIVTKSLQPLISRMSLSALYEKESDISIDSKLNINEMHINVYQLQT